MTLETADKNKQHYFEKQASTYTHVI